MFFKKISKKTLILKSRKVKKDSVMGSWVRITLSDTEKRALMEL